MIALAAAILWLLVALGINAEAIDLIWLGAALMALHFAIEFPIPVSFGNRRDRP